METTDEFEEYKEWVVTQLVETITCQCGCSDPLSILIQREEAENEDDS